MEIQEPKRGKRAWMRIAVAGAAMMAAAACGGCLYTVIPAMAGPSTTYPQPAAGQPSQASQPSADQTNQTNPSDQNKQQNGMPPNGAHPQGQGGTL
jgi:hypothetical protein